MTKLLMMLAVLASVQGSATPQKALTAEPRQLADEAMRFVAAEDMKGLFAFVAVHMPLDRQSIDKLRDDFIEQRKKLPATLGKSLGPDFVRERRLADYLVRLVYVEKREKSVLRWQFVFYKARSAWTLTSFNFDENLNGLFAPCD